MDVKRLMEKEDEMFRWIEKDRDGGCGWIDSVPDVKRRGKLNSYKIFSPKTLQPTSLWYAGRRRGGMSEKERSGGQKDGARDAGLEEMM